MVDVHAPYVAGFLAFREVSFLVEAVQRLEEKEPALRPQVLLVDGNGILHHRGKTPEFSLRSSNNHIFFDGLIILPSSSGGATVGSQQCLIQLLQSYLVSCSVICSLLLLLISISTQTEKKGSWPGLGKGRYTKHTHPTKKFWSRL
uniref:Endonuclease V n=1 Tax=Varanus komodoensis TaxID=61221 RepID=A0A8D2Q7P4_VARKO